RERIRASDAGMVHTSAPERGRDGDRATIHATDPRDPSPEVGPGPAPPRGGPEPAHRPRHRLRRPGEGHAGRAGLAYCPDPDRRDAGGAALHAPPCRAPGERPAAMAGLRVHPPGTAQARRHPATAAPRVPRAAPGRVSLHAVLRDLSPVAHTPRPVDASGP